MIKIPPGSHAERVIRLLTPTAPAAPAPPPLPPAASTPREQLAALRATNPAAARLYALENARAVLEQ